MSEPFNAPEELDEHTHWVSQQCEQGLFGYNFGPLVNGIVKFALVWDVIWLYVFASNWRSLTMPFVVSWLVMLFWVNIAPYLIWFYDEVVMPEFFNRFIEIAADPSEFARLAESHSEFYSRPHYLAAAFWGIGVPVVAWSGTPVFQMQGLIAWMPLMYVFAIYIGVVLGGPGFMGPIVTLHLIREISTIDLDIQPLHPDQLGGLSNVGYYSIRTTLLFSTASLFLPLAFRFSATSSREVWIYLFVLIYITTVISSFVYPTYKINRAAATLRDEILEDIRTEYSSLQQQTLSIDDSIENVNRRLEMQRLRAKYDDYKNVRLYPLQIDMLLQLAGSIFLPLLFVFVEAYLGRIVALIF